MKRALCIAICLLLLCATALGASGELVLPDPSEALGQAGTLLRTDYPFSEDYLCDAYTYPLPDDADAFLARYAELAENSGFSLTACVADGVDAYRIERADSPLHALLFPEYQGKLLLLVPEGMRLSTEPEPTPTPQPTPEPSAAPTVHCHLENRTRRVTCPICFGNKKCTLCNGTGVYRAYGESVPCEKLCVFCDGLGYYEEITSVWVPD